MFSMRKSSIFIGHIIWYRSKELESGMDDHWQVIAL